MQKILIAHSSQELTKALYELLQPQFEVISCADGNTALEYICQQHPDAVILDIMLSNKDGITVLEDAKPHIPPVVLATTTHRSLYIESSAEKHGIGFIMLLPCDVRNIVHRLQDMLSYTFSGKQTYSYQEELIADHLLALGFDPALKGYTQLKTAIPLFARDTAQGLDKEIYPAVAKILDYANGDLVERNIRNAIRSAWEQSDKSVWTSYFPGNSEKSPSNKQFISRLAILLSR